MKDNDWKLIVDEIELLSVYIKAKKQFKEEIISDLYERLVRNEKLAATLCEMIKNGERQRCKQIILTLFNDIKYKAVTKTYYNDAKSYMMYKRIEECCIQNNIGIYPDNAYKISALMNDKDYSIVVVERLLRNKKPKVDKRLWV